MREPEPARSLPRPSRPGAGIPGRIAATAMAGFIAIHALHLAGLPGGIGAWLAASALYLLGCLAVALLMRRGYPHDRLGGCNVVTLLRGALICALLPPLHASGTGGDAAGWAVAAVGGTALALDGVDGWLARRSGLASGFGARFDMEVDAALALVLALHALADGVVGAEVLLLGLIRYVFLVAGWLRPWLRAPLPQRFRRKLVCVVQLAVLVALQVPVMPPEAAIWATRAVALALLWSFATDIRWLARHRG